MSKYHDVLSIKDEALRIPTNTRPPVPPAERLVIAMGPFRYYDASIYLIATPQAAGAMLRVTRSDTLSLLSDNTPKLEHDTISQTKYYQPCIDQFKRYHTLSLFKHCQAQTRKNYVSAVKVIILAITDLLHMSPNLKAVFFSTTFPPCITPQTQSHQRQRHAQSPHQIKDSDMSS